MPFNSAGTHTPVHDWTQDRDNGIKIEASRMDTQHADFSGALTNIVKGTQPFKGKLQGVNGTVSVPAFSFEDDPDTGWYLSAANELSAATGGVQRFKLESNGTLVVTTSNYENLVLADDDIPNRKWVTDYTASISNRIIYVDSENGSDSNDGLQPDTAFLTISAAVAVLGTNDTLGLLGGSGFREHLDLSSKEGIKVRHVGGGRMPWISGRDAITSFTSVSGNVYKFDVTLPAADAARGYPAIFQNGERLYEYLPGDLADTLEATIAAALEADPGSFFFAGAGTTAAGWSAGTKTYYLHVTGGGNPTSHTIETPVRQYALTIGKDTDIGPVALVLGLHHNGIDRESSTEVSATFRNGITFDPGQHGSLMDLGNFENWTVIGHNGRHGGTGFHTNPTGSVPDLQWKGLKYIGSPLNGVNDSMASKAFYTHAAGSDVRGKMTLVDCYGEYADTLAHFEDVTELNTINLKGRRCTNLNVEGSSTTEKHWGIDFIGGESGSNTVRPFYCPSGKTVELYADGYIDIMATQLVYGNAGMGTFIAHDQTMVLRNPRSGSEGYFFFSNTSNVTKIELKRCVLIAEGNNYFSDFLRASGGAITTLDVDDTLIVGNFNREQGGEPVLRLSAGDSALSAENQSGNRVFQIGNRALDTDSEGKFHLKHGAYKPGGKVFGGVYATNAGSGVTVVVGDVVRRSKNNHNILWDYSWESVHTPTAFLNDVTFSKHATSTSSRWIAVGQGGLVVQSTSDDFDAGSAVTSGTSENLYSVSSTDDTATGNVVAVGANGTIIISSDYGATWAAATTVGSSEDLYDVCTDGGTNWLAVGTNGVRLVSTDNGDTWAVATLEADCDLRACWYSSANSLWIVGGTRTHSASDNKDAYLATSSTASGTYTKRTTGTRNRIQRIKEDLATGQIIACLYQDSPDDACFLLSSNGTDWEVSAALVPFQPLGLATPNSSTPFNILSPIVVGESEHCARNFHGTGPWHLSPISDPDFGRDNPNYTKFKALAPHT